MLGMSPAWECECVVRFRVSQRAASLTGDLPFYVPLRSKLANAPSVKICG